MGILLGFLPFIAFALLDRWIGLVAALAVAAAISAVFLVRDALGAGRTVKLLEVGTVLLFGGLALWTGLAHHRGSVIEMRLYVDGGLLAIVLVSLAVRQPFTLQYAKEQTPPEVWRNPAFLHVNDVITAGWAAAFAAMVAADLLMLYVPAVPLWVGIAVTVAALLAAVRFTLWYTARVRARRAPPG